MPQVWAKFIEEHFLEIWLLSLCWVIGVFTFRFFWHRSKGRYFADPSPSAAIYAEGFASGRSLKSWRTRFGGASNCLKLVLTKDRLFVRPFFPFLIFGPDIDLVHSIPLSQIESVAESKQTFPLLPGLSIKFRMPDGAIREIELRPKHLDQFKDKLTTLIGQIR